MNHFLNYARFYLTGVIGNEGGSDLTQAGKDCRRRTMRRRRPYDLDSHPGRPISHRIVGVLEGYLEYIDFWFCEFVCANSYS